MRNLSASVNRDSPWERDAKTESAGAKSGECLKDILVPFGLPSTLISFEVLLTVSPKDIKSFKIFLSPWIDDKLSPLTFILEPKASATKKNAAWE